MKKRKIVYRYRRVIKTDNVVEAYKSVIDFNKVVLSISSTILAVLISYLVSQNYPFSIRNVLSPVIFFFAITFSLLGFGHSIPAIQKNQSNKNSVRFSNISGILMLVAIISIILIKKETTEKFADILNVMHSSAKATGDNLNNYNFNYFLKSNDHYEILYKNDSSQLKIIYSIQKQDIISWKKTNNNSGKDTAGNNGIRYHQ